MRAAADLDLQNMLPSVRENVVNVLADDGFSLVWAEMDKNFTLDHACKALERVYILYVTT